ncbi:glutamate-1-semialdehyde 2,1-aminomutase [Deinococcus radiodurans]|jgi:glutamate-1-semialdehyde 2,1-aminomutase (EC 5.4.3.8)|uniref:Glutamate-1-semialdehyde 2,1-aminomutase n=1 Tax=Deinococcus radiodurans (strain ATCC 13939 / DSM 20539 / JCM 16871 / CCUG 27074 / LMG 4051 / NBRC 15346 / NCIMB 9279 / VKM B-1422 / R1) TaxID=243230 RepID=GSA_DEIRA|nr:glutamate-1-semialdehyde 2,1-aminomutase [Deinococcus radiodurans]Q9RWW0.2 RecName: Full=Glutamate-1-semialdehyde 2,1-aminomutase; Short=GSA; AltName: Full=Glutamate-1-semialdehyde aminotransferase; Short=GSA-AT [Deinococcus radiodurans R1 = ATCC 13939 = DSM 20539]ANC72203.1 glutamate-1-semialdehyde aminotransferase [Deinococcus radiodurans R1 = ATCC 13939 = DSM 20539]QIP28730.1 glutamate-1-semialdehyde 2,1-aminomutase [Deinococcus radiodurans]QIP32566.1 glutamate-1-semialdehyde 2,1-aminomut
MTLSETHPTARSEALFVRARAVTPGGVNSPVRAFRSVGGVPRFIASAQGAYLTDADGARYLDYIGSWGPMILGHNHPAVRDAVAQALASGTSFGAPNEREVELAELIVELTGAERVRFVSSGTEATMSALRLARGYTGRKFIVKFRGNYHGHADGLLVEAGSGLLTNAEGDLGAAAPSSAGVPEEYAGLTLVLDYNDPEALDALMAQRGDEIAAVIFEPVVGNAGVLIPTSDFLAALHRVRDFGAVLIADEVMTGFRLSLNGATGLLSLDPDLRCWGKIVGGGLPVGAYGGRADIMDFVSPQGPVYQAGTLSGNPLAMAAGIATLRELKANPGLYRQLDEYAARLAAGLRGAAERAGVAVSINHIGSMLTVFFQDAPDGSVRDYAAAARSDTAAFAAWFQGLLARGIYWAPSQFESIFISAAHGEPELAATLEAAAQAFEGVKP